MSDRDRNRFATKPLLGLLGWLAIGAGDLWAANGQLVLRAVDSESKAPVAVRLTLKGANGRPVKPKKVVLFGDHFLATGSVTLVLPLGNYAFEMERGPEYPILYGRFQIDQFADDTKTVEMKRHVDMAKAGWYSGDLDVRREPADLPLILQAEDLHVAAVPTRLNDKNLLAGKPTPKEMLFQAPPDRCAQFLANAIAGGGGQYLVLNQFATFPTGGEKTTLSDVFEKLKQDDKTWIDASRANNWDLPMLVALGLIDSVQIADGQLGRDHISADKQGKPRDAQRFPDPWGTPQWSQEIYFRLLNCGVKLPPSAGSGSGANSNPAGYNRMYAYVDGPFSYEKWTESARAGHVTITNGPLLQPVVNGELPGHVFQGDEGKTVELEIGLTLSTREPISYLEIIKDGKVAHSIAFKDYAKGARLPKVSFDRSGWMALRAVTDLPRTYRFAMTAPYYVYVGYAPHISRQAAQFFLDWVTERGKQFEPADEAALAPYKKAHDYWRDILSKANTD